MALDLDVLQTRLNYQFSQHALLSQAATHPGWLDANLDPRTRITRSNERLEFLGDALLGAAICDWLYERFPTSDEGDLSQRKGHLVSRRTLAQLIDRHQLLPACQLGPQYDNGQVPASVKANLAEALLAAVYLDGGYQALCACVRHLYGDDISSQDRSSQSAAWKNILQKYSLEQYQCLPAYDCRRTGGSDHAPEFTAQVVVGDHQAENSGGSRRQAEAAAAEKLCQQLGLMAP